MAYCSDDRKRIVEAKLVERNTFLEFEPALDAYGARSETRRSRSYSHPNTRQNRSYSDPLVGHCCGEDAELRSGSMASSDTMSIASSQLHPHGDDSTSVGTESESDSDVQQEQPCPGTVGMQLGHQISGDHTRAPQGEPLYYYYALPGTQLWSQFNATNASAITGDAPANKSAADALRSAEIEARVAQLQLAAERLKAAAAQVEAQAQGIKTSMPCMPMAYWPTWNTSSPSPQFSQEPEQGIPACQSTPPGEMTTVMLRNIPNDYTRAMLLELMDSLGLAGRYDFVYLPIDFHRSSSLGYAFVNFNRHEDAVMGKARLHGFSDWTVSSQKVCEVCWGEPLQGQIAHVERYRSSPVMHHDVPDEFKPIIFKDGVRVPFPPPSKRVRPPRSKRSSK